MSKFKVPQESIAGLPTIDFEFDGPHCRAKLAGATLLADCVESDRANVTVTDAHGVVLADVMVRHHPPDHDITESVLRVGSALLWSHARYVEAKAKAA